MRSTGVEASADFDDDIPRPDLITAGVSPAARAEPT